MKPNFLLLLFISPLLCFSQSLQLKLTNVNSGKSYFVKNGNKVLIAYKLASWQFNTKSPDVYVLSKAERADSAFVFAKARLLSIGDSTIIVKERISFFSSSRKEIKIEKLKTVRKLTMADQLFARRQLAPAASQLVSLFFIVMQLLAE